jgi:hypothetical protein
MRTGAAVSLAAAAVIAAGCGHSKRQMRGEAGTGSEAGRFSIFPAENGRRDCAARFAACAPPTTYPEYIDVDAVAVMTLVPLSWRLDVPDDVAVAAAKRLRKIVEVGELQTLREIAAAAENHATTAARCRCAGDRFKPEYEKQQIGPLIATRLPPSELEKPSHWVERLDPHLTRLRGLSRQSAELAMGGNGTGNAELDALIAGEEQQLCEDVHAARGALSDGGMDEVRELLFKARARESGDASVDAARRALEKAERQASCTAAPPAAPEPAPVPE